MFLNAMDSFENIAGTQFLEDFNGGEFKRIIDVGDSQNFKSLAILKSNLKLEAVVFNRLKGGEGTLICHSRATQEQLPKVSSNKLICINNKGFLKCYYQVHKERELLICRCHE